MLLLTAGETQCLILEDVSHVFSLKIEDRIATLHSDLGELIGTTKSQTK